jgi:hypothetical protein
VIVGEATVVVWHEPTDRVFVDDGGTLPVLGFEQDWPPMDGALSDAFGHGARLLEPLDYTTAVLAAVAWFDGRWLPADAVRGRLDVVDAWLDRRGQTRQQPWFRPDWFAETDAWIDGLVRRTGSSHQVKQWGISAVLRTPTTTGAVYAKAVLPALRREPLVTDFLAACAGDPFARLIAVDGDRWLAEDFGGTPPGPDAFDDALRRMVAIQQSTINTTGVLAELGCPSVSSERLAAYGIPDTVVHRDLHPGNVVVRDDGVLIHDWSFASIGCPLLDLGSWLWGMTDAQALRAVEVFIDAWSPYVDPSVLRAAWRVAKPLSAEAELAKFTGLIDLVGPAGAFAFAPVARGWDRRLQRALANPDLPAWGDR